MAKKPKTNKRQEAAQAKLDAWRIGTADQSPVGPDSGLQAPPQGVRVLAVGMYTLLLNEGPSSPSYAVCLDQVKKIADSSMSSVDERIQAWNAIRRVERYVASAGEGDELNKNGIAWELRRLTDPLIVGPAIPDLPEIHYEARYTAEHDDWIARIVVREVRANRVNNAIKWCQSMSPARKQKGLAWIETEAHVHIREAV